MHDLRNWTSDVHRTVDDTPYGGGPGMVMRPEPWGLALDEIAPADGPAQPRLVVPTPGRPAVHPGGGPGAGRASHGWCSPAGGTRASTPRVLEYAGQRMPCDEIRLGDYVLCRRRGGGAGDHRGGRPADPGRAGQRRSRRTRTLSPRRRRAAGGAGLHQPAVWRGMPVPEVLPVGRPRRDRALAPGAARCAGPPQPASGPARRRDFRRARFLDHRAVMAQLSGLPGGCRSTVGFGARTTWTHRSQSRSRHRTRPAARSACRAEGSEPP